jgi:hypothetical protein
MKNIFLLLLILSSKVFAQNYYSIQKTNINKFVLEKDIEWAIYKNDSLFIDEPDLRKMLIEKVLANNIKAFAPIEEATQQENKLKFYNTKECEALQYDRSLSLAAYNEEGNNNATIEVKQKMDLTAPKGEIKLSQILYCKNGILYAHINRVSPLINVTAASGVIFGKAELFSTGLNNALSNFNSKNDKIIFLKKTTTNIFVDSIKKENKLKEMFGHNIIEALWPYIESNKINFYTVPENKKVTIGEIEKNNLLHLETLYVPIYDSVGNLDSNKLVMVGINANIFDKIAITQEWFYNETKNIVFCKIPEAILSANKKDWNDTGSHEIKIVF